MKINGLQLYDFGNKLETGHIKVWKANGMIATLVQMECILDDNERLIKYVRNCLEMEGFDLDDCTKVAEYLLENR